jgi:hypothetical protein
MAQGDSNPLPARNLLNLVEFDDSSLCRTLFNREPINRGEDFSNREFIVFLQLLTDEAENEKTKVASPRRESSNQLSETLEEWNDYLER